MRSLINNTKIFAYHCGAVSQMKHTDAELARVSVLILDVTRTAYVSPVAKRLASVMKNFNKKIDRKNLNFVNKTAI